MESAVSMRRLRALLDRRRWSRWEQVSRADAPDTFRWGFARRQASTHSRDDGSLEASSRSFSGVTRLSRQFVPTQKAESLSQSNLQVESLALLLRGGYIRQSSSGHFTLLPNGLRMLKKLEKIIDEEMSAIGSSRLEMPTMLSSALWHKSGRMQTMEGELYRFNDRRGSEYILAPTAEEEVTKVVGDEVHSWRQLPVRVHQITTKHRDEPRPRSGLLRTRSFLMKDLYSFDATLEEAQQSYRDVTGAYHRIMTRIFGQHGRDWKTAVADTGAMGGQQSHEYQVADPLGEDILVSCDTCGYAANSELAASAPSRTKLVSSSSDASVALYGPSDLTEQGYMLTALVIPKGRQVNPVKVEKAFRSAEVEQQNVKLYPTQEMVTWDWQDRPEGPMVRFDRLRVLVDHECRALEPDDISDCVLSAIEAFGSPPGTAINEGNARRNDAPGLHDYFAAQFSSGDEAMACELVDVRQAEDGDTCAACHKGTLASEKTIEVGHTFLLGTRYSEALGYSVQGKDAGSPPLPLQMGCYGIGLTRILGVLAQIASRRFSALLGAQQPSVSPKGKTKAARTGFAWNANTAPYHALVLPLQPASTAQMDAARQIVTGLHGRLLSDEQLSSLPASLSAAIQSALSDGGEASFDAADIALDDRASLSTGVRLAETDLIGYPLVFVIGKAFEEKGQIEVRYRDKDGFAVANVPLDSLV